MKHKLFCDSNVFGPEAPSPLVVTGVEGGGEVTTNQQSELPVASSREFRRHAATLQVSRLPNCAPLTIGADVCFL